MKERPIVIIHGWSDKSKSFHRLASMLSERLGRKPRLINLADYISMDDAITFADLTAAMTRAWRQEHLPEEKGSVDVIVHSTAGLIIRDWLVRNYTANAAPIKHLVMLAPANFGSQLAHRGRAFYGRVIKGFSSQKMFNVGAQLLKGLELASPYSWQLAFQDRFAEQIYYQPGNVLCTVLIGNSGLGGISAAANEDGSDGVVRVSCANMNCAYLQADFSKDPQHPTYHFKESTGIAAFGVMDLENHHTIALKDDGPKNPYTIDYIIRGLTVSDENFSNWLAELNLATQTAMEKNINNKYKHGFQNTVVYVTDQFQQNPEDYFLEFFAGKDGKWFEEMFYQDVIRSVHAYSDNKSYRSIYINCTAFYQHLHHDWEELNISLTALPEFQHKHNVVGYRTFTDNDIGSIKIDKSKIPEIFVENRTLLTCITIRREQAAEVFRISHL